MTIRRPISVLGLVVWAGCSGALLAGEPEDQAPSFDARTAYLEPLIGAWDVTEIHYDLRGEKVAKVKGTEEIGWILDRRAIRRVYTTRTESSAYHAIGTLTWSEAAQAYRGVWFDDASTNGPTSVTGTWSDETESFIFALEVLGPDESPIGFKVVERLIDDDKREATTFSIRDGEVTKRMTVLYKRSIPCPSGPRAVFEPVAPGAHKREKKKRKRRGE